jgi:hypothetical protein
MDRRQLQDIAARIVEKFKPKRVRGEASLQRSSPDITCLNTHGYESNYAARLVGADSDFVNIENNISLQPWRQSCSSI